MTRLAITLLVDGGSEVPVAMRLRELSVDTDGWKKRAGTEPHVRGAMKEATAVWPG